jgi:hypothetical protein
VIVIKHTINAEIARFLDVIIGSLLLRGIADQFSGFGPVIVGRRFTDLLLELDDAA